MKQKPFWRQLILTGIPFGVGMALLWWWFGWLVDAPTNILFVVSFGLLSAVVFGVILTFYERWRWGQLEATESPIFRRSEGVILSTPAFHDLHNGWLTLTRHGLLFKVRSSNYRDRLIRFSEIEAVKEWRSTGSSGTGIEIDLVNGETALFEMEDIEPWRSLFTIPWAHSHGTRNDYLRNPLEDVHA